MTAHMFLPAASDLPAPRPAPGRPRRGTPGRPRREQGSSPHEGERLLPLTRRQVEDRAEELGDLYAATSGGGPWAWNRARTAFLRHLAAHSRRPGFSLLIAETTVLTGCAYGFPAGIAGVTGAAGLAGLLPGADGPGSAGAGPWWPGHGAHLRGRLPGPVGGSGRLFVVSGLVVPPRVRRENQDRPWNLARRLQRRLLADDGAALGVMLVDPRDVRAVATLRSWGWRSAGEDTAAVLPYGRLRVLVLAPGT
jgi:hypothetical protein